MINLLLLFQLFGQNNKPEFIPIVFVHGMLASGDTWTLQFQRFEQQGYQPNHLQVVDWNTVAFGKMNTISLDSVINHTLQSTGAKQVNLVGHSAGGGVCTNYINNAQNAAKIAHYAHIGSGKLNQLPSVATMNIYSLADKISGGSNIEGATNIALQNKDHYEVATSIETFNALFQFFNNASPKNELPLSINVFQISGKAVSFGENKPESNARIEIFVLDPIAGKRKIKKPVFITLTDTLGKWTGFKAKPNEYYEFVVTPTDTAKRVVHYFREPFKANNSLVYLRVLGKAGMAAMITRKLPVDNAQTVLAIFSANAAVISGRDSLTINDITLLDKKLASAAKTAIAFFLFDDGDKLTSRNMHNGMGMLPFMNMVDVFLPTGENKIKLYFNGRTMYIPYLQSAKDGIMVAVFD
jgi:pimeloyl-ACP methyl ester carboxylesterase